MKVLVIPPVADLTVAPDLGADRPTVIDANAAFIQRLCAPAALTALSAALDRPAADHERSAHALMVGAAAQVLLEMPIGEAGIRQDPGPDATVLRAVGAVMRAASLDDPAIRLTVDDVELVAGSTECAAEADAAGAATGLFKPELAEAAAALQRMGSGRVVLDCDKQLPAVLQLSRMVGPGRLILCGRFAATHRDVLAALPELAGAQFDQTPLPLHVLPEWLMPAHMSEGPARWVTTSAELPAHGAWVGWLDAADAADIPPVALERCRGLTLTVADLPSWDRALAASGSRVDIRPLVQELRRRSVPVGLEVLVGAPGIVSTATEATVGLIADFHAGRPPQAAPAGDVRLAGFRPFQLTATHTGRWNSTPLGLAPVPPRNNLPRRRDFKADATLDPGQVAKVLRSLAEATGARHDLYPGRLAAAVVAGTRWRTVDDQMSWDPAVRVEAVRGAGPDGRGPGTFLVSLRTGRLLRADDRLAALLRRLSSGGPAARELWQRLPAGRRADLFARLRAAGAVRGPQ
jgi:hypothetical protein